jgi:hypothetical protein
VLRSGDGSKTKKTDETYCFAGIGLVLLNLFAEVVATGACVCRSIEVAAD